MVIADGKRPRAIDQSRRDGIATALISCSLEMAVSATFNPVPCQVNVVTLNIYNRCRVTRFASSFFHLETNSRTRTRFRLMVASDLRECAANKMNRFLHEPMTANRSRSDIFDGVGEVVAIQTFNIGSISIAFGSTRRKMNCIRP